MSNLTKSEIIDRFEGGVFNKLAFIHEALKHDQSEVDGDLMDIDPENFVFNWRGAPDPDTGKVKEIDPVDLLIVLLQLHKKGAIVVTLPRKIEVDVNP